MSAKPGEQVVTAEVVNSRPAKSSLAPILLVLGILGGIGFLFFAALVLLVAVAAFSLRTGPAIPEPEAAGIVNVTDQTFAAEVLDPDLAGPILVDFHASWCGPCRTQGKILTRFAANNADVKIAKVDVDQNPELASRYDVRSIPTLLIVKHGEVTAQHVGLASESELTALLQQ